MPDYRFRPAPAPSPELAGLGYSPSQLRAVARLRQLAESLSTGSIGLEWYSYLSQRELHRVGWAARPRWGACGSPPTAG